MHHDETALLLELLLIVTLLLLMLESEHVQRFATKTHAFSSTRARRFGLPSVAQRGQRLLEPFEVLASTVEIVPELLEVSCTRLKGDEGGEQSGVTDDITMTLI